MSNIKKDLIHQNSIFLRLALATGLMLLIPLIAMIFTAQVQWDLMDFLVMGILLYGTSSIFVLVARKIERGRRLIAGILFSAVFLFVWAELAVGVFTDFGS